MLLQLIVEQSVGRTKDSLIVRVLDEFHLGRRLLHANDVGCRCGRILIEGNGDRMFVRGQRTKVDETLLHVGLDVAVDGQCVGVQLKVQVNRRE